MARASTAATQTVIGAPARLARAHWRVAFARDPMATSWLRKRRLLEGTLDLARSAQTITQVCTDELAGWSGVRPVFRDLRRLTAKLAARNILGDDLSPDEVANLERALDAVQTMFVNSAQLRFSIDTPQNGTSARPSPGSTNSCTGPSGAGSTAKASAWIWHRCTRCSTGR